MDGAFLLVSSLNQKNGDDLFFINDPERKHKFDRFCHNLTVITQKTKGQRFYVLNERICIYQGLWKLWYLICRIFCGAVVNAALQQLITETIKTITPERVKRLLHKSEEDLDAQVSKCFRQLFFDHLAKMNRHVFDRDRAISNDTELLLIAILQREKNPPTSPDNDPYVQKIDRVRLALKLGIDFELLPEGTSGAYVGRDIRNNKICKVKPNCEGPYGPNVPRLMKRIQQLIKAILTWLCLCFKKGVRPSLPPNQEYLSEVWASITSDHCKHLQSKFNVVPTTRLETFTSQAFYGKKKTKVVSCQLWVEGSLTKAGLYFSPLERQQRMDNPVLDTLKPEELERLAILAFIAGDQDKASDNWSVVSHEERTWASSYDNGCAYPKHQPNEWLSLRKQHLWADLPFAKCRFSKENMLLIEELRRTKDQLVAKLKACQSQVEGKLHRFSDEQARALEERIEVLFYHAKYQLPILELAKIKTPNDYAQFLKHYASNKN